jgi:hypothetical protein
MQPTMKNIFYTPALGFEGAIRENLFFTQHLLSRKKDLLLHGKKLNN